MLKEFYDLTDKKAYFEEISQAYDAALSPYATPDAKALRWFPKRLAQDFVRSKFGIDIDKILHNPLYNRYADKTQVFSFYRNDDITRRALHVQLVSRISRNIGRALKLNLDLIEAIALGHDMGHTPFGHKGEQFLNAVYHDNTGRYFMHNVHSVRVFKLMTHANLTLQTLDGILCHCGEKAFDKYQPHDRLSLDYFEDIFEKCYLDETFVDTLRPGTLEGCVVRISDMIAYVGKDRQDADKAGLRITDPDFETETGLGAENYEIIRHISANIIKNSIGKDYLRMDEPVFAELTKIKKRNTAHIYENEAVVKTYHAAIEPMMRNMYGQLREDVTKRVFTSPVFQHHINNDAVTKCYRDKETRRIVEEPDQIVVDYIASMTDDYFIDLYRFLFPGDPLNDAIEYHTYFESSSHDEYIKDRAGRGPDPRF